MSRPLDTCTMCGKTPCKTYAVRDDDRIVAATRVAYPHYCHACARVVVERNVEATTPTPERSERDWRILRRFKSKSNPDEVHEVRKNLTTGEVYCTCRGYTYVGHCRHMDRVIADGDA